VTYNSIQNKFLWISSFLICGRKEIEMSNSKNTKESFLEETKAKFPLLKINPKLTKVMPPDEVIELVNACVSLSGYSRNDIRNAFFRALSIPAFDVYVDADQRCKVAIDIVVNGLENRFPDKPKLEYEWKGESSNISELRAIDKYGNGLFTDYCVPEPSEFDRITEIDGVFELKDALEVTESPEVQDAPEIHGGSEVAGVLEVKVGSEVEEDFKVDVATTIPDVSEAQDALEVHNASEVSDASIILDAPKISYAPEVDSTQEVDSAQEDDSTQVNNVPEDSDAVEFADAQEIPSTPEVYDISEVHDSSIVSEAPQASETMNEVPELVRSSPSPVKKRAKKALEASHNTMILEQILQELKEIKALLKDKQ
jgi:hypothetical protein